MVHNEAYALFLVATLAFVAPVLSRWMRLPEAVMAILIGVALGTGATQTAFDAGFLRSLADFGFLYLMFLAGLEVDFDQIQAGGPGTTAFNMVIVLVVFGLSLGASIYMGWPLVAAFAIAAMSLGLVVTTLVNTGRSKGRLGQRILLLGSLGEFLTLVLLTFYIFFEKYGLGVEILVEILKLLGIFLVALVILLILRRAVWWYPHRFERIVCQDDPSEIGVRAGLALMIAFAALAAFLEVEKILGAFLAGMMISFVFRRAEMLRQKLASLGNGFFIPIFFLSVGVGFSPASFFNPAVVAFFVPLFALSLLAKLVPMTALLFDRFGVREVLGSAFLLSAPVTLMVAIAKISSDLGVIDSAMADAIVMVALAQALLFPSLFQLLFPRPKQEVKA